MLHISIKKCLNFINFINEIIRIYDHLIITSINVSLNNKSFMIHQIVVRIFLTLRYIKLINDLLPYQTLVLIFFVYCINIFTANIFRTDYLIAFPKLLKILTITIYENVLDLLMFSNINKKVFQSI